MQYHPKIITFFKKHNMYDKETFDYLKDNTTPIDYENEDERILIGCAYILNKKDILKSLRLVIPYVIDDITALISIHEMVHGIENYPKIGKKFKKDLAIESLPLLYEKIYIQENPSEKLIKYGKYIDYLIEKDDAEEYKFALYAREKLLEKYDYNMANSQKLVKKLVKKYR